MTAMTTGRYVGVVAILLGPVTASIGDAAGNTGAGVTTGVSVALAGLVIAAFPRIVDGVIARIEKWAQSSPHH